MKSSAVLAAGFAVVMSSVVHAEAPQLGTYLIGNWTVAGKAQGGEANGTMTVRPAAGGESLFYTWTLKYPDESRRGSGIVGIDPSSGKMVEHVFSGDSRWTSTYEKVLGDAIGETTGTQVGVVRGEPLEGKITVKRTSKDRFTYKVEAANATVVDFVFERRGEVTDGEEAFKAYAKLTVGGTWISEVDGVQFEDTYKPILDGRFLQLTSKPAGEFSANVTILGIDPVTKKFTWWGYHADGFVSIGTSRQVKEGVWVGPWNARGSEASISSRGRLTKVDDDTIKYEILERTIKGDLPEFPKVTIWKRKR